MRRTVRAALATLAVSTLCVGCGGSLVDKQGVPRGGDVVTLRLGAADPGEPSLAYFVDAVDRASAGRLAVEIDRTTYFSETPGGPAGLAPDLTAGKIDLAMIPSRDWASTGDPRFAALQAPFLVTSTFATIALARSDIADDLLEGMAARDAVGLGLVPGEPRRLLTREPVIDESDLSGARIRVSDSDQTMALLSRLGADPVQGVSAADVRAALQVGTLDGVEIAPVYLSQNGYNLSAPYLTSFALIPKFEVLAASSAAWKKLSSDEQDAVSSAAAQTVDWQSSRLAKDEATELSVLCNDGLVVVAPSASSLEAWRAAAPSPDDATASAAEQDITTYLVHTKPANGTSDLPENCVVATSVAQARRLHRTAELTPGASSRPHDGPRIPSGTYQERVTAEQFAAAGLNGPDFAEDITYTWVLHPDGSLDETQDPDYPDQGRQSGRYIVDGYQWTATYDPGPTGTLPPERAHWSYYEGVLTFTKIEVQDPGALPLYQRPWHKIG